MAPKRKAPPAASGKERADSAPSSSKRQSTQPDADTKLYKQALLDWEKENRDAEAKALLMVSKDVLEKLVGAVVRLMLFKWHKDGGVPVPRTDLSKAVNEMQKKHGLPGPVISLAQRRCITAFGYEMRELEKTRKPGAAGAPQKVFVLRSLIPEPLRAKFVDQPADRARAGFKSVVLALVSMAGETCGEQTLKKQLKVVGVTIDEKEEHAELAGVDAEMARLVKQRYLTKDKVGAGGSDEQFVYALAENALDDFGLERISQYIKDVMGRKIGISGKAEEAVEVDDGDDDDE